MENTMKCPTKKSRMRHYVDLTYRYPCDEDGTLDGDAGLANAGGTDENPDDPALMVIAAQHSIMQDRFENMVGEYFYPNQVPYPETRTASEMQAFIKQAADKNFIKFEYDDFDRDSNIMTISVPIGGDLTVYSAFLFRGIFLLHTDVTEFHFYKAIDESGFTVAIAAVDGGGKVLYLGELAGLFP